MNAYPFNFKRSDVHVCCVMHVCVCKCVYIPVHLPASAYVQATGQLHVSSSIALHINFWDMVSCWTQRCLFLWHFLTRKPTAMPDSTSQVLVLHSHAIMSGFYVGTLHPSMSIQANKASTLPTEQSSKVSFNLHLFLWIFNRYWYVSQAGLGCSL